MIDPIHLATLAPWLALGAASRALGPAACAPCRPLRCDDSGMPVLGPPAPAPIGEPGPTRPIVRYHDGIYGLWLGTGAKTVVSVGPRGTVREGVSSRPDLRVYVLLSSTGRQIGTVTG